ncbi:MAG: nuclear transport factor 2 family protein, partial [Acidobacteria bacterium]|nr:nuclear transport factor 2 family protein [Acidobacteriota bacterium]
NSKPLLNATLAELQAVFAARMQAYTKKDYETLVSHISPDFSATLPDGQTINYEQIKTYMRRNLERFVSIESQNIAIENAMVNGNEAVIDARQIVSRVQKFADGSVHNVTTSVLQQETWVKTANGWKLKSVGGEREQSTLVDGKPLSPNKP